MIGHAIVPLLLILYCVAAYTDIYYKSLEYFICSWINKFTFTQRRNNKQTNKQTRVFSKQNPDVIFERLSLNDTEKILSSKNPFKSIRTSNNLHILRNYGNAINAPLIKLFFFLMSITFGWI